MPKPRPIHLFVVGNVALAFALLWTTAQSQTPAPVQQVLRARAIELVNERGDVVAELFSGDDGGGQLRMRNGDGEVRIKLGVSDDGRGAALILMDAKTEPAVQLRSAPGGPGLLLD
jgi:hypothetical protein